MNIIEEYKKYKEKDIPVKYRNKIKREMTLFKKYFNILPNFLQKTSILEDKLMQKK